MITRFEGRISTSTSKLLVPCFGINIFNIFKISYRPPSPIPCPFSRGRLGDDTGVQCWGSPYLSPSTSLHQFRLAVFSLPLYFFFSSNPSFAYFPKCMRRAERIKGWHWDVIGTAFPSTLTGILKCEPFLLFAYVRPTMPMMVL